MSGRGGDEKGQLKSKKRLFETKKNDDTGGLMFLFTVRLRPLVAIVIITTLKEEVSRNSIKVKKVQMMCMLGMDSRVRKAPLFVCSVKPKVYGESF